MENYMSWAFEVHEHYKVMAKHDYFFLQQLEKISTKSFPLSELAKERGNKL